MSDFNELVLAVLENPDDDSPRLALADWFEFDGQLKKAEFIRLQLKIAAEMGGFDPFNFSGVDMYLDPENSESQAWKHRLRAMLLEEQRMFSELSELPPIWWSSRFAPGGEIRFTCSPDSYLTGISRIESGTAGSRDVVALVRRGYIERVACRWVNFIFWESHLAADADKHLGVSIRIRPFSLVDVVGTFPHRNSARPIGRTSRDGLTYGVFEFVKAWPGIRFMARCWPDPELSALFDMASLGLVSRRTAMSAIGFDQE